MVKGIKALTPCLWPKATLGQKLERVSGLTFIYWYGLGLEVAERTRNERTLCERDTLVRFQEEPTQCSSQFDLVTDDKFWHFRKYLNYGRKTNTHGQPCGTRACGKRRHPAWCCWEAALLGKGFPGKCFHPSYTIPSVVVVRGCLGTACASAVAVSGCLLLCVCSMVGPHGLCSSGSCFAVMLWSWATSLAPHGHRGNCLEKSVFWK